MQTIKSNIKIGHIMCKNGTLWTNDEKHNSRKTIGGRLENNAETNFSSERGKLLEAQTADGDSECCRLKFAFQGIWFLYIFYLPINTTITVV